MKDLEEAVREAEASLEEATEKLAAAVAERDELQAAFEQGPDEWARGRAKTAAESADAHTAYVRAYETRLTKARAELKLHKDVEDREELSRLGGELASPIYVDEIAALIRLDRVVVETVLAPLERANKARLALWEKAKTLADRVGDFDFPRRHPRPKNNEAISLARIAIDRARVAESRPSTAELFTSWTEPPWNDRSKPAYDAAAAMLSRTTKETHHA